MKVFHHHSARARCHPPDVAGVARVDYLGPLTSGGFSALASHVLSITRGASALDIRMDDCLMVMASAPLPPSGYIDNATPGCVIVRDDQYVIWRDYAAALAAVGIRRVVFLVAQRAQAAHWLARQVRRHRAPHQTADS